MGYRSVLPRSGLEEFDGNVEVQTNPGQLSDGRRRGSGFGEHTFPEFGNTRGKTDGIRNYSDLVGGVGGI
jgi:hypothetical protein